MMRCGTVTSAANHLRSPGFRCARLAVEPRIAESRAFLSLCPTAASPPTGAPPGPRPRSVRHGGQHRHVPRISEFYGIVITMYWRDHPPPHFHAAYGGDIAEIEIETGRVIDGSLPPRALRLVQEWLALHVNELQDNWNRARAHDPLIAIDPLP